jgi:hypothetical protein
MWPFIALGGALWWLSHANRNPTGAGFRDRSGRFHPIRSSEWYQPSLLDVPETVPPVIEPAPVSVSPSGSAAAAALAERLRALEAKRRDEVAARSSSVRFHLREAAMAGGGVMTARRRSGLNTRDRQIRKSFALADEADSFARRAAYQEARAQALAASEEKVSGGPLSVGSRVHLWYTWGYGQYEGIGTIVKRLKNGWSVKREQSRSTAVPSPMHPRPKEGEWEDETLTPMTYPAAGDKGYTANRAKYPKTGIDGVYVNGRLVPVTS